MARLTVAQRKKLPKGQYAGPNKTYPVPDKTHAANAKARATQAVKAGRMTTAQKARIDSRANKVLGTRKTGKK